MSQIDVLHNLYKMVYEKLSIIHALINWIKIE